MDFVEEKTEREFVNRDSTHTHTRSRHDFQCPMLNFKEDEKKQVPIRYRTAWN